MAEIVDDKIDKLLDMPKLAKAELFRFVGNERQQFKDIDPELFDPVMALHKVLSTRFSYFNVDSHGETFQFPESKFESGGCELATTAQRPGQFEDTFKN